MNESLINKYVWYRYLSIIKLGKIIKTEKYSDFVYVTIEEQNGTTTRIHESYIFENKQQIISYIEDEIDYWKSKLKEFMDVRYEV